MSKFVQSCMPIYNFIINNDYSCMLMHSKNSRGE